MRTKYLILLAIALLFNISAKGEIIASGTCGEYPEEDLTWTLDDEGHLVISGTGDMAGYGPSFYDGIYVTSAPWGEYYKSIKEISIGSEVTSIGHHAFYGCSSLISVSSMDACKKISSYAFCGCTSLTTVGELSACTYIGAETFSDCSSLTSVGDLSACNYFGNQSFAGCNSLEIIHVNNLKSWCENGSKEEIMRRGNSMKRLIVNGVECTNLVIPDEVETIPDYAFHGFGFIETVTMPNVKNIGSGAFGYCSSLTSLGDLPNCVNIGYCAFMYCTSLTSIGNLPACTSIDAGAFWRCSSLTELGDMSACVFIGGEAFNECPFLSTVGDLSSCTSIGRYAFSGCHISSLTLGNVPSLLEDSNAIPACTTVLVPETALNSYKIAENWSNIAERIVSKDALHDADIIIDVTPTEGSAIQNAIEAQGGNVSDIIKLKVTGDINAYDIFVMRNKMPNLHIVDLSEANIKATENGYCYYGSYSTVDDVFPANAFYQRGNLLDVKLPKSLTSIDDGAFSSCGNVVNVDIYEGVKRIGNNAFYDCGIRDVVIPEGCLTIGNYAFEFCRNLENIQLPTTLKCIEGGAFWSCHNLSSIVFPDNLNTIASSSFGNCDSLTEITLPSSLNFIGSSAFSGCNKLTIIKATAVDPKSVQMYDDSFENYTGKTLYIPYDEETGWDATYNAYYWHTQWGQFGTLLKWKPTYENVYINNDYDQSAGTIPGENIDAEFDNQSGYILGDAAEQEFNDVHIKNDGTNGGSIIADDNLNINNLYCEINVQADRWYFFCFPFDVRISDIVSPGLHVLYKYNGNERSQGNTGWVKLGNGVDKLIAGKGYIFQTNTAGTLLIPVSKPNFNASNKSPQLDTWPAANKQDASWNLIGNPYLSYYELEDLEHAAPVTYWNGYSYVAVRPGDDDYAIQPYQAFFVQKTEGSSEVGFDEGKRETYTQSKNKASKAKARRAEAKINPERLLLNVTITDGETVDQTRVVFNDKQLMEYEAECDASKFMSSENVPQLYTYYNNVNYAINERPNGSGEVQLCFKAPKDGVYTISMARMDTPMLLKDAETGTTFDFQNGDYTFEAVAGTNTTRFLLVKNNSADAIQPVTVGDAESAEFWNAAGQKTSADAKGVKIVKTESGVKKVLTK